jgi:hypothetical protein
MSTGKWGWKPREVERALEVARKHGLVVRSFTISKAGDITVLTAPAATANEDSESPNPWDDHHAAD